MNENKKAILMILDGWGIGKHDKADVIDSANTINYHNFLKQYPHSQLLACG
ncbi:MAG: hypothetical protein J6T63_02635, partial [Bacteroidales bacterium]|nr:hypothetical protein [Bacteroidales bacterium]